MIGNNKLQLNEATMLQAVQYWLNSQMREGCVPPKVTAIYKAVDGYTNVFVIKLSNEIVQNG